MNKITKEPISSLGYNFVKPEYIPKGKDEYYLRNIQHRTTNHYRQLTAMEIRQLIANDNTSDNWNQVFVTDVFNADLVQHCKFYGLVRIGKLEPYFLEFNNLRMPVGLYNSTIISSDFGDNVSVDNVNFLSHYIVGNDVIIANINELATTDHAKFGNGILRKGEKESVRIWLELCNENAGRSVLPFNGMMTGDAYLWTKYRGDDVLQEKFKEFTEKKFDKRRGYYGKIGDRTVIKNTSIIKDVWIASDAYIKGANKLKNLTINSSPDAKTQIGEGCELVNGIIGYGCRIFYGVKAVRFIMSNNSQLKYGARLINSYLGDNSTISCCEVLNSLIFPAHEQHHNNSFLCAALVMGQSNMAAGATIGSNHNSRGPDGEIVAGRGFWPGLCVSLKHNSKFASFTIIAKGDFPAELNIPFPFSLVNNDVSNNQLVIMPGYWFMYNMYALARNAGKYAGRDKRTDRSIDFEYDFLAPDTVNEIFDSLEQMKKAAGETMSANSGKPVTGEAAVRLGEKLLSGNKIPDNTTITAQGMENTNRKTILVKLPKAYRLFQELIRYYATSQLVLAIEREKIDSFEKLKSRIRKPVRHNWLNVGGQLIPEPAVKTLIKMIHQEKINGWDEIHEFYKEGSNKYPDLKFEHAMASVFELMKISPEKFTKKIFFELLQEAIQTRQWMTNCIYESRAKDYQSEYRKMVYESEKEMEKVLGKLKDNSFINQQKEEFNSFKKQATGIVKNFQLEK
ncbi:MAG: DUF4954 family protein [Chitinophagaceae bacterium]|nr:DUF4954 family protein [Chitinophagaceae bacterium]